MGIARRRGRVITLRRPQHPLAVLAVEQRRHILIRRHVPQSHGLIVAAGQEPAPVGRNGNGPDDEPAEGAPREIVGGEKAVAPPLITVLPSGVKVKALWAQPAFSPRLMVARSLPSFTTSSGSR